MKRITEILIKKPTLFVVTPLVYAVAVILLRWGVHPTWSVLWFLTGIFTGIYFLDVAEEFFKLTPSPFRSIVFCAGFVIVSLFVVTSSGSELSSGLVLSITLMLLMWQMGQWKLVGNLDSWYKMISVPVSLRTQLLGLIIFIFIFVLETLIYFH